MTFRDKNYLIAINKIKYKIKVDIIAAEDKGKIIPVLSHLTNLIFLLITFGINLKGFYLKLLNPKFISN